VEQHGGHEDGHGGSETELKQSHEHRQGGRHHLREHHRCNLPGERSAAPRVAVERFRGRAFHPLRVVGLQQHVVVSGMIHEYQSTRGRLRHSQRLPH